MKGKVETETRLRIANSCGAALRLFLEPWGREYVLHPEDEFIFAFHAATSAQPEVIYTKDGIEVWAWSGATVEVFKNGTVLTEYVPEAFPDPEPAAKELGSALEALGYAVMDLKAADESTTTWSVERQLPDGTRVSVNVEPPGRS